MYFWRVNPLVEDLKNGRVTQRQKMYYYLAGTLLSLIYIFISSAVAVTPNLMTVVNIVLAISVTVGGILLCYEANHQGDDTEFIDRFVCLSWPINMRMIAVLIPIYIVAAIASSNNSGRVELTIVDVLITLLYSIYFYKWLHLCLMQVSQPTITTD